MLTVFYFKGLLLSFSSYASQFSPQPEHPLSLYTGAAQKFRRVNTPAEHRTQDTGHRTQNTEPRIQNTEHSLRDEQR